MDSLRLAMHGIGLPRTPESDVEAYTRASEVGLLGVAAELAQKACVLQVAGTEALSKADGSFKTAGETLHDYRRMLRSGNPRLSCLTADVPDPGGHLNKLLAASDRFPLLFTVRASGLHAARGVNHDVAASLCNDVVRFLTDLSASSRMRPYLDDLPGPLPLAKDRLVLVEELAEAVAQGQTPEDRAMALRDVFLVLPEIPEMAPEWLDSLQRVSIAPRRRDITCLMDALQTARNTHLARAGGAGTAIPVRVAPENALLTVAPHYLRRAFTRPPDQWHADVANANGRLNAGMLDLPPRDFVYDLFVLGLEAVGIPAADLERGLTAQQSWPFVASSLAAQGTRGPFWFIVRSTVITELGQLSALLARASTLGTKWLRDGVNLVTPGIQALQYGERLPPASDLAEVFRALQQAASVARAQLEEELEALTEAGEAAGWLAELGDTYTETASVGSCLVWLLDGTGDNTERAQRRRWADKLCRAASDADDREGLVLICRENLLSNAHTHAKQALSLIDFLAHGPRLDGD